MNARTGRRTPCILTGLTGVRGASRDHRGLCGPSGLHVPAAESVDPETGEVVSEIVRLMAPNTPEIYRAFRSGKHEAAGIKLDPAGRPPKLKPDQKKLVTIFPGDWVNTIGVETGELQAAGWSSSPCEGQVRAELRRRGLPDLAAPPMVTLPSGEDAAGRQARRFRHFARTRREGGIPGPPPGLFHLTLTLQSAVTGPRCLGWGCHFGLGSFVPGDTEQMQCSRGYLFSGTPP